jgi:FkbM family methyltransferase
MWRTLSYLDEHGNKIRHLQKERKEQILAEEYVLPDDCVLELGARYGTVSCVANKILLNKTNHVVVEPDARVWSALDSNRIRNGCEFHIIRGFLSRRKMTLYDTESWDGYGTKSRQDHTSNIPTWTLEDVEQIVSCPFTVLIADCEGFLEQFLDENPTLLDQIRLIIFEKDNAEECDYKKIKSDLTKRGFKQHVNLFREVWKR